MDRLFFLTSNNGKLAEAKDFFLPLGYEVEQFLIEGEIPEVIEPQSDNLQLVASSKIQQAAAYLEEIGEKGSILVEDAGLFIDELNGFPGVYSASTLEKIGLHGILKLLDRNANRGAEFRACAALWDGNKTTLVEGICRGIITTEIKGSGGFGFDPIFAPLDEGTGRTFGEMNKQEKGLYSHRSKALNLLKNELC